MKKNPRILIGLIYGGRDRYFDRVVCSLWDNTAMPFDLVLGCNVWDTKVADEIKKTELPRGGKRFHIWKPGEGPNRDGNLGHFPMANLIAKKALDEGYDMFVDVNDDVTIAKGDWLAELTAQFRRNQKTRLVTFVECVPNTEKDLHGSAGKYYADEFASAIFAADVKLFIRKHGLFDPQFIWYSGDSDLGWRVARPKEHGGMEMRIAACDPGWIKHDFHCGKDLHKIKGLKVLADADTARLHEKWK